MSVPLIEQGDAAGTAGQPQYSTTGAVRSQSMTGDPMAAGSVDFQPGGPGASPALVIGSVRLGYEDVLLIIALAQVFATATRLYLEVSD